MKYSLRTDQFCALSTDQTFHQWLEGVDQGIYVGLQVHLKRSPGCRANKEYMKMVRRQLSASGLNEELIKFLRDYFPTVLKPIIEPKEEVKVDLSDLNKHGVFRIYKPHILTFPHKYIIIDVNREQLDKKVAGFTHRGQRFGPMPRSSNPPRARRATCRLWPTRKIDRSQTSRVRLRRRARARRLPARPADFPPGARCRVAPSALHASPW